MRILRFCSMLLFLAAFSAGERAFAQQNGYDLGADSISTDIVDIASIDFDAAFAKIDNAYLSDMMRLNYQIDLLEKMVARQSEIEKIQESYATMGIQYDAPPPPRGICAQLPPNAACLKAYPDLYADLVDARKAYFDSMKTPVQGGPILDGKAAQEEAARLAREEAERREREEKLERQGRYQWSDISCAAGSCRGVIQTSNGNGFRATVRNGTKLHDGTIVQSVSGDGVRVVIEGEAIALRPATESASGSQVSGTDPLTAAFGQGISTPASTTIGRGAGAASAPVSGDSALSSPSGSTAGRGTAPTARNGQAGTGDASHTAASGQAVDQPALGPSGLF